MNAYRPIFFIPGRSLLRFPIAALVEVDGVATMVIAGRLPDAGCLGGDRLAELLAIEISGLRDARSPSDVVALTGPTVELGEPVSLSALIDEPARWVESYVLPVGGGPSERQNARRRASEPQRRVATQAFLAAHRLTDIVKPTFKPGKDFVGVIPDDLLLPNIEQWVEGDGHALLLEPLVPTLSAFGTHAVQARSALASYRDLRASRPELARRFDLVAYVLGGRERDAVERQQVLHGLGSVATVYDVSDSKQCRTFVEHVRDASKVSLGA